MTLKIKLICDSLCDIPKEIQDKEPELWQRISKRIAYMKNELHIEFNEDILPMCSTVAYLRPFLLNKEKAMTL